LNALLKGIEAMKPLVVVMTGRFISNENNETESNEHLRQYFEEVGRVVRDNKLEFLRDHTLWLLVPSLEDPGIFKLMPNTKLSESLISSMKGTGPMRIKNLRLATNPCRISFMGKEVVLSRYNFFRKLKTNHLP
jgi:DNA polymerase alpha/epsilon subunit B